MTSGNGQYNPLWDHAPASEESLPAIALIDDSAIDEARALGVTAESFFLDKPRWAWQAECDLRDRGALLQDRFIAEQMAAGGKITYPEALQYVGMLSGKMTINWRLDVETLLRKQQIRRRAALELKIGQALRRGDDAEALTLTQSLIDEAQATRAEPAGLIEQFKHVSLALEPRENVPHLIEHQIPAKALIIPYGRPGSFKTNYLMECCFSIASGQAHLVGEPPDMAGGLKVFQAPALWFDADSGLDELLDRARAFGKGRGLDLRDLPFHLVSFPDPPISAARGLGEVITAIQNFEARFVVMDNLLRIAGVPDENSPLMDSAMSALRATVAKTGATIAVIHHPTKNRIAGDVVDGDDLRGHSSILASVDLALRVTRSGDVITVKATKWRRNMPPPFAARFAFTHQGDGETLDECRFFACESPDSIATTRRTEERRAAILAALNEGPVSFNNLHDIVKGRRDELKNDLSALIVDGLVEVADGPRHSKLYSLRVSS